MRIWLLLAMFPLLGGCHLGARPQDFDCAQADLQPYMRGYAISPLVSEIQRDAGHDNGEPAGTVRTETPIPVPPVQGADLVSAVPVDANDPIRKLVDRADRLRVDKGVSKGRPLDETSSALPRTVLLLSGGAGWGAFGAGFLKAEVDKPDSALRRIDLVTGVSTGAIQALFVAGGDYDGLRKAYWIKEESELVKRGGLLTVLRKGYLGDTDPLRQRIEAVLCDQRHDTCPGLARLNRSPVGLAIGMVEARTGDFKVVNLSDLIDDAYRAPPATRAAAVRKAARCVAGVVMGSAAVPVQMRPVRLGDAASHRYTTYTDGGVRYSAFETVIASLEARLAAEKRRPAPDLYIIRNGPTVVTPLVGKDGGSATIDTRPDVATLGLQSYSTIVNQTELMSIAGLRLVFRDGSIMIATADGYGTPFPQRVSRTCHRSQGGGFVLFDPQFMQCLETWGAEKARGGGPHEGWITLSPLQLTAPDSALRS